MWTEKVRSWRKKGKRGVSPIIATILLVAITVVLAAVLYILISGLTKGPGNTPLGTAFGYGTPSNISVASGTAPTGCSAAAHNCYSISIASAGGGIQNTALNFQVTRPGGGIVTVTQVALLSISGTVVATYTGSTGSWSTTVTLSTTQTLVVDVGAYSATSVSGDTLVALGVGSYSGQVTTVLP